MKENRNIVSVIFAFVVLMLIIGISPLKENSVSEFVGILFIFLILFFIMRAILYQTPK
jgi:hypothetical protein